MNTPHHENIETAFLQLSFSIKLWKFLTDHPIQKKYFDINLVVQDPSNRIFLPEEEFHTYQDILTASENNISIAFGATAITLWEAIRQHNAMSIEKINPSASLKYSLAALSYMIRCCFAHGTAAPVWSIRNKKFKIQYHVGNKIIDLSNIKEKQIFDYQSIGGYETLWQLKAEAFKNDLL